MTNRVVLHCHLVSVKQNLPSKINSLLYIFSHLTLPNSIILIIVFYLFFKFPLQNEVTNCVRELGHSIDCFWKLVSMDQCTVENWIGLTYIWPDKMYISINFNINCLYAKLTSFLLLCAVITIFQDHDFVKGNRINGCYFLSLKIEIESYLKI